MIEDVEGTQTPNVVLFWIVYCNCNSLLNINIINPKRKHKGALRYMAVQIEIIDHNELESISCA